MAIPDLDRILRDMRDLDNVDRAVQAASEIDRFATVEDIPLVRRLMREGDYFFRECLGSTLANLEGPASLPFLLEVLREGEGESHDHDGLGAAIMDLVEMNKLDVAPLLKEMSKSECVDDRRDAAWLWGFASDSIPIESLLALSHDENPRVRKAALGSLGSYKRREDVFQSLVAALDDPEEHVRIAAVSTLGYYGDARAIPLIEPFLQETARVRQIAEYALSKIRCD